MSGSQAKPSLNSRQILRQFKYTTMQIHRIFSGRWWPWENVRCMMFSKCRRLTYLEVDFDDFFSLVFGLDKFLTPKSHFLAHNVILCAIADCFLLLFADIDDVRASKETNNDLFGDKQPSFFIPSCVFLEIQVYLLL